MYRHRDTYPISRLSYWTNLSIFASSCALHITDENKLQSHHSPSQTRHALTFQTINMCYLEAL